MISIFHNLPKLGPETVETGDAVNAVNAVETVTATVETAVVSGNSKQYQGTVNCSTKRRHKARGVTTFGRLTVLFVHTVGSHRSGEQSSIDGPKNLGFWGIYDD